MALLRSDFAFDLPPELIAQEPRVRGRSRMLVVSPGAEPELEDSTFNTFTGRLVSGDVLVLNDTRVFPARLAARPIGNMKRGLEILLVRELEPLLWKAWAKPAKRLREGSELQFTDSLHALVEKKSDDGSIAIRFDCEVEAFWNLIEAAGVTPLPPYIRREESRLDDHDSYQTVYADRRGAVAAPTAGLHFTPEILEDITSRGVTLIRITLHVGLGTFAPMKVENVADHRMEIERYEISEESARVLELARREGRRVVAVGTTSVRTLESALQGDGTFLRGWNETGIFITPGYEFKVVDALLTNFHLPESTLIMLVSAFAGMARTRKAYFEAINKGYFFYSYGDCMFISSRTADALRT